MPLTKYSRGWIINHMRRICVLLLLLISFSLYAAITPNSERLGRVAVSVEENSNASLLLEAFGEEYTESWLKKYTTGDDLFPLLYSDKLSKLLPIKNIILGENVRDSISFYSSDSNVFISATFKDGKIYALDISTL